MSRPPHKPSGPPWPRRKPAGTTGYTPPKPPPELPEGRVRIFGYHAVGAVLDNPARHIERVLATENAEHRLQARIAARGLTAERVMPRDLDRLLGPDTVHQGIALEVDDLPEPDIDALARQAAPGRPLLLLDQVTDPHNVGAILRSAAAFGACGLVMTRRHSPQLSGALAKAASGALELVPVCRVQNLARTMTDLQEAGVTLIGLDSEAEQTLEDMSWPSAPGLVLGAEGRGLRQLTRESCDRLCRIDTASMLASLNVSNAAAVALHIAWRAGPAKR